MTSGFVWAVIHVAAYVAVGTQAARTVPRLARKRKARVHRECLERITKLEVSLGLGVSWALDQLDSLEPAISQRSRQGYSMLKESVFRCHGCEAIVAFRYDYDGTYYGGVDDDKHLFCNDCLPKKNDRNDRAPVGRYWQ